MKIILSNQGALGMAIGLALAITGCATESLNVVDNDDNDVIHETTQDLTIEPRRELFEIDPNDTVGFHAAQAQLFGVQSGLVTLNADGSYTLQTSPFTSEGGTTFCPSTSFYGQPHLIAGATGVLVGPNRILTASHTLGAPADLAAAQAACNSKLYIANYAFTSQGESVASVTTRSAADVYFCNTVVYLDLQSDVAIVTLDRAVTSSEIGPVAPPVPLKPRRSGALPATPTPAVEVGYPHRLPAKFELGSVQANGNSFSGQLHVALGNSGAGVVNAQSGRLEGIVQTGYTGTVFNQGQGCYTECTDQALCPGSYQGSVGGPAAPLFAAAIPPQGLEVTANADAPSVGPPGGPFTNPSATYTLTAGLSGLTVSGAVSVTGPLTPVVITPNYSLAAGASKQIKVKVDASATASMVPGTYDSTVSFTDTRYKTLDTFHHSIVIYPPCVTNQQCVPAQCCHPTSCTSSSLAPNCQGIVCTANCQPGTMDCGQGHCECNAGACGAVIGQ